MELEKDDSIKVDGQNQTTMPKYLTQVSKPGFDTFLSISRSIHTHQAYFLFEQVGVELEKDGSTKADGQNQNHNPPYSLFHISWLALISAVSLAVVSRWEWSLKRMAASRWMVRTRPQCPVSTPSGMCVRSYH